MPTKTSIIYYIPEHYFSPRLHVFEELMGSHWDEVDASVRDIQKQQTAHITSKFNLRIVHLSSTPIQKVPDECVQRFLKTKGANQPIVTIDGEVKKVGKFLSPKELAAIFDGFSVQIPNDPDEGPSK